VFIMKSANITDITLPDPVTFTVKATSDADTPITYTWYHYEEDSPCENKWCTVYNVANKTHITHNNGSSLAILKTEPSDLGEYRCVASNGVSEDVFTVLLRAPDYRLYIYYSY